MAIKRIEIVGVPVDIIKPEELEMTVLELLAKPGTKQIVFLSIWELLKARKKGDFRDCVKNADLIIPISKSIIKGAVFLKKEMPIRYNPFSAVIQLVSILDAHFKSLYMFGSNPQTLQIACRNVKATFPTLSLLGRQPACHSKDLEKDIIQAIYKASPSLVLVSEGVKEKDCWAYRRRNEFSSSIFLYYKDLFGIFSKRIRRIDESVFNKGHEIFVEILKNPLKIFRLLPFMWYIILIIWYKGSKK